MGRRLVGDLESVADAGLEGRDLLAASCQRDREARADRSLHHRRRRRDRPGRHQGDGGRDCREEDERDADHCCSFRTWCARRPLSPRAGRGRFGRSPRQTPRSARPRTPLGPGVPQKRQPALDADHRTLTRAAEPAPDRGGDSAIRIRVSLEPETGRRSTRSDRRGRGAPRRPRRPRVLELAVLRGESQAAEEGGQEGQAEGQGVRPPRPAERPGHGPERQDHAAAEAGQPVAAPGGRRQQRLRRVHVQALAFQPDRRPRRQGRRHDVRGRELRRLREHGGDDALR